MFSYTFLATIISVSVTGQVIVNDWTSSPITLESTVNSIPNSAGIGEIKAYNSGLYVNNNEDAKTTTYCPFTPELSGDLGHFCDDLDSKLAWFTVVSQGTSVASPGVLHTDSIGQTVYMNKTTGQIQYTRPHIGDVPLSETDVPVKVSLSNTEALSFTNEAPASSDNSYGVSQGQFWLCETDVEGEFAVSVTAYLDTCYSTSIHYRYTYAGEHHGTYLYL